MQISVEQKAQLINVCKQWKQEYFGLLTDTSSRKYFTFPQVFNQNSIFTDKHMKF